MENIISQVLGVAVIACVVLSMQAKNVKTVLILQMLCNGLSALSYLLVDGASASIVTLVAVVQTVVYYIIRAKGKTAPNILAFFQCLERCAVHFPLLRQNPRFSEF